MTISRWRPVARAACVSLLLAIVGCDPGYQTKTPTDAARKALTESLDAWRRGEPPGEVRGADPAVHVIDTAWQSGQKLESYEIVSEEDAGDVRHFSVRLITVPPSSPPEVRYMVLGNEPTYVHRESDYEKMLNMDDNPVNTKR